VRFFRYRGIGAGAGGCGRVGSAGFGATSVVSEWVGLCVLKHGNEQLYSISIMVHERSRTTSYYGSAQVGHLYFLGSALQTPQRTSAMVSKQLRIAILIYM
jgi:hypothetical protein